MQLCIGWLADWHLCLLPSSFDWMQLLCLYMCVFMWTLEMVHCASVYFYVDILVGKCRFLTQSDHYFKRWKRISITTRSLKAFIFQWNTRKNLWFLFRYEFTLVSRLSLSLSLYILSFSHLSSIFLLPKSISGHSKTSNEEKQTNEPKM